jgi:protein-L-isoaspartate(D-aspartate) O-methyltransferase
MMWRTLSAVVLSFFVTACTATEPAEIPQSGSIESFVEQRIALIEQGVAGQGVTDPAVLDAMKVVPRHLFVPEELQERAYRNQALPIGYGQTISQPFIVGLMTQELEVIAGERVLEIGTGSGYQAAVLAELGVEVYTIEIIEPLATAAISRFQELGYDTIRAQNGDGYFGWPEEGIRFDGIIVTAAPDHVPQPLLGQLKIGAILVIPVGPVGGYQELWKISRIDEEQYQSVSLGGVRFVPLTREFESE